MSTVCSNKEDSPMSDHVRQFFSDSCIMCGKYIRSSWLVIVWVIYNLNIAFTGVKTNSAEKIYSLVKNNFFQMSADKIPDHYQSIVATLFNTLIV